jgi:UDP-N-acetylmuramoyl-tripeptide--D-alanyl-D-alanine ligase
MNIFDLHQKFKECKQEVSTDTRIMNPGSMFFAWKGENIDGNTFAGTAIENGAKYVVIDNPDYAKGVEYILVDNAMETLQQLARYHRQQFQIPVIAIGGSNGKTTTKEFVSRILATQKNVVASFASLNNHVGVPLTLLRVTGNTDAVVLEMGANHLGEIAKLCQIAEPTHGLITNIGRDHIGSFGSQSAIIEANIELYDYLKENNGYVFINHENMTLMKYAAGIERTCYAENLNNEFGIASLKTSPYVSFSWKHNNVTTQLTGEYNIENIAAAISVGIHFNTTDDNIIQAIASYSPTNNRSEILETTTGNIVIKDFYNANLTSMKYALENLAHIKKANPEKTSIAIMGDMLELGEYSLGEHQAAIDYARQLSIDRIVLVGPEFQETEHNDIDVYANVDTAIFALQNSSIKNSVTLLKASNGTNFKKLFDTLNW